MTVPPGATPRRNPWPLRIAVGCGGALLTIVVLVAGLATVMFWPQRTDRGLCHFNGMGTTCTQVPPVMIGQLLEMELPPGTTVQTSEYVDWMDDVLSAEVIVPPAQVPAWEASLGAWRPCGDTPSAACNFTPCPPGARCANADDERQMRSYARYAEPDGSVRLRLDWAER